MAISRKLLNDDETVLVSTRTHLKALIGPLLLLMVIAAVAGYLGTLPPGRTGAAAPFLVAVIWGIAALAVLKWVVLPFLTWLTTTYTVTNRRLITRSGIVSRHGRDIPLSRINDVGYEHGIVDRMLGCGTLILSAASDEGRVVLHDIPHVEQVHLVISDEIHGVGDTRPVDLPGDDDRR